MKRSFGRRLLGIERCQISYNTHILNQDLVTIEEEGKIDDENQEHRNIKRIIKITDHGSSI